MFWLFRGVHALGQWHGLPAAWGLSFEVAGFSAKGLYRFLGFGRTTTQGFSCWCRDLITRSECLGHLTSDNQVLRRAWTHFRDFAHITNWCITITVLHRGQAYASWVHCFIFCPLIPHALRFAFMEACLFCSYIKPL